MTQEILFKYILPALITVVLPFMLTAVTYFIKWLSSKLRAAKLDELASILESTTENAVRQTYQTYVDSLKKSGNFGAEAQVTALKSCVASINELLPEKVKKQLKAFYPEYDKLIISKIESCINKLKK